MISLLDNFILGGTAQGDPVMGTDSITLAGVVITGVWSGLSGSNESEFGGMQSDINASVVVPSAAGITLALIGKTGTVKGQAMKCVNLDIGEALTTLFFENASKTTSL